MDILERIIEHLTSDEVRRFKILSNRFKADEEKKVLILFDAIRNPNFKEIEEDVVRQLYGSATPKTKNSYYRLRNKLLANLEKSLLFYHFNYKNSIESFSNVQLAILYRERGLYREAYHSLKKAEKVAIKHDQFNVLEVIYDEMVKLVVHFDLDIEGVIERRKLNLKKMELLRANSEVLGTVTQQLRRRNYSRNTRSTSVIETLDQIREQLEEHQDIFQSPSGKIMIMKTVLASLIQKSAYQELANYIQKVFVQFEEEGIFTQDTHNTRILLRIWRINSLQKLLRLAEAEPEIEALREDLVRYKRQNFNEFAYYYYAPKVINLKLMGKLRAAEKTLKEGLSNRDIFQHETHELFLMLNLADQLFSQQKYGKALESIRQILQHRHVSKLDEELRFYIHVFQIVNLFEAGLHPKANSAFKSVKKTFKRLLKDEFYAKAKRFLDILMRMNHAAQEGKRVFLKSAHKQFVQAFPPSEIGSNEIIRYETYLESKLEEDKPYYELLVEEVSRQT